jgi:hypothetical protein
MAIRVTVEDLESGETETTEIENDYVLVCAGTVYLERTTLMPDGSAELTVVDTHALPRPPIEITVRQNVKEEFRSRVTGRCFRRDRVIVTRECPDCGHVWDEASRWSRWCRLIVPGDDPGEQ